MRASWMQRPRNTGCEHMESCEKAGSEKAYSQGDNWRKENPECERHELGSSLPSSPRPFARFHIQAQLCSPDSPWLHHLHPQGLQQSLTTYWLTVSLIFPLSFPCLSSPYNWNKNCLREEPVLYNFPSHSTVPGPDLNTIKEVLFNMCLGTEIQYCPYTKGRLCPRLTTPGFCKCSMMCFQAFDSHGCTAALHFTSRLLGRLIYTTVSVEQLSSCTTGFTGFWSHNFTGNTLRKSQWAMLPKPVLH